MRILLVAPDQPNLNAIPEIRRLSEMHTVHVFNGPVRYDDLHDAVRHNEYDVIHFATHMVAPPESLDMMALSSGDYIDLNRAVQLCKLAKAKVCFFNLCLAARFGAYLTQRGAPFVIFTTVEIPDEDAWSTPVSFYERCRRAEVAGQSTMDFKELLESVDGGDGLYHWAAATNYYGHLLKPLRDAIEELRQQLRALVKTVEHHAQLLSIRPPNPLRSRLLIVAAILCGVLVLSSSALVVLQAIYSFMQ